MKYLLVGLCLAATTLAGCNYAKAIAYLIAPSMPDKTEEAEYKDLPGKKVAVVVYAEPKTLYDYPTLREQISGSVSYYLSKNVSRLKTVAPEQIVSFQNDNPDWEAAGKTGIGKKFGADFVLYIAVVDFSTLEPGSTYLHRGHVTAQVALYKCDMRESESCAWSAGEINLAYPENEAVGQITEDDRQLRNQTIRAFSEMLAKKFYKHKVEEKK